MKTPPTVMVSNVSYDAMNLLFATFSTQTIYSFTDSGFWFVRQAPSLFIFY